MTRGIDIFNGEHDRGIDFARAKVAGIQFAIVKATEGVNYEDPSFTTNVDGARAAGMDVGAYHLMRATPIDMQAADFIAAISGHGPYKMLAIDVEDVGGPELSSLGKEATTDKILTIYRAIRAAGYTCAVYVYASASWLRSLIDVAACRAAGMKIWMAAYSNDTPDNTDHSADCDMWQWCSDGHVEGISGNVDCDVLYGAGQAAQPTASVAVSHVSVPSGNANVRTAQQFYNARGAALSVDGIYGPATRKALIMSVQRGCNQTYSSGIAVDGIWGPKTEAAIRTLRPGDDNSAVWPLQAALMAHGYSVGGIDGKFGSNTESAVKAFQRDNSLTVDGLAGRLTFTALCK